MGYGAHMSIKNNSSKTIKTNISAQECMYDNGSEGSRLSLFNELTIKAFTSVPSTGGQYIEAKASGSCAFSTSTFDLKITGLNKDAFAVNFSETVNTYYCKNQPSNVDVSIDNSGDQAFIIITLTDPNHYQLANLK